MLVFFIHGVATHQTKYADTLKSLLKEEFDQREKPLPHFYSSFWGDVLKDVGKIWNCIHQDLQAVRNEYSQSSVDDIFRYRQFREGFLSEFGGDFLSYLNPERGATIRKLIAQQLDDFLEKNPEETELHIIAHSLGSVILWDALFSERFNPEDAAFEIRAMIKGFNQPGKIGVVDAHSYYWTCPQTAYLITASILGNQEIIRDVINRLDKVPGMTNKMLQLGQASPIDTILEDLRFRDGSGTLHFTVNPVQVHHVYVFDNNNNCKFSGYVGWLDSGKLKQEIGFIKNKFCKLDSKTWMQTMKMRGV